MKQKIKNEVVIIPGINAVINDYFKVKVIYEDSDIFPVTKERIKIGHKKFDLINLTIIEYDKLEYCYCDVSDKDKRKIKKMLKGLKAYEL